MNLLHRKLPGFHDITVSIIRDIRPEGLFRYFEEHGIEVLNPYAGIYYVLGAVLFPTQIVVGRELERDGHIWIKALSPETAFQSHSPAQPPAPS